MLREAFQRQLAGSQALTVTTGRGSRQRGGLSPGESCGLSSTGSFRGLGWEATSSGWGGGAAAPDCLPLGKAQGFENLFSERGGNVDGAEALTCCLARPGGACWQGEA